MSFMRRVFSRRKLSYLLPAVVCLANWCVNVLSIVSRIPQFCIEQTQSGYDAATLFVPVLSKR